MATKGIPGLPLVIAASGAFLVYIGIKGTTPLEELRSLARGVRPEALSGTSVMTPLRGGSSQTISPIGVSGGSSATAVKAAQIAQQQIGVPYRWGGSTPDGFDCSGLIRYSYVKAGAPANFPRTTATEIVSPMFRKVSRAECQAGDLTWWPGHVGIAINNKQGVYAPHAGTKVQIQNIDRGMPGLVILRYQVGESKVTPIGPKLAAWKEGQSSGPR